MVAQVSFAGSSSSSPSTLAGLLGVVFNFTLLGRAPSLNLQPQLSPSLLSSRPTDQPAGQHLECSGPRLNSRNPLQSLSTRQISTSPVLTKVLGMLPRTSPLHPTSINKSCGLHAEYTLCTHPILPHPLLLPLPMSPSSLKSSLVFLLPSTLFSPQLPSDPCKM